ncbi:hypothetical protein OHA72_39125 [Dactylosporangium sp. NBC_01737]|uniref:hypothetical protein n=1 Tax=Dactylosporangium sp. NBC_01737 TaxID=2975959 RepID=UPI002E11FAF3|nr:hypothetical protein OHA72_39125 [Dactylosporangium sp. NBC_01737]
MPDDRRASLVAAVHARLDRARRAGDPAELLGPAGDWDIVGLTALLDEDAEDLEAHWLLGSLHWHRGTAGGDADEVGAAVERFTVCFVNGIDDLPDILLPVLAQRAAPFAVQLLQEAAAGGDPALVRALVGVWQRITAAGPDDPDPALCHNNLAIAHQLRLDLAGDPADLDAAVVASETAVAASDDSHPQRGAFLLLR